MSPLTPQQRYLQTPKGRLALYRQRQRDRIIRQLNRLNHRELMDRYNLPLVEALALVNMRPLTWTTLKQHHRSIYVKLRNCFQGGS